MNEDDDIYIETSGLRFDEGLDELINESDPYYYGGVFKKTADELFGDILDSLDSEGFIKKADAVRYNTFPEGGRIQANVILKELMKKVFEDNFDKTFKQAWIDNKQPIK